MHRGSFGSYLAFDRVLDDGVVERYVASHRVLGTPHVVDVLTPAAMTDDTIAQGFVLAARARAQTEHHSIARVDECSRTRDGRWYVVSPPHPRTLAAVVDAHEALPRACALELVARLASAVETMHAHGIGPGPLTPARIGLVPRGGNAYHPVLVDVRAGRIDPIDDARALAAIACALAIDGDATAWRAIASPIADGARESTPRELVHALAASVPRGADLVRATAADLYETLVVPANAPGTPGAAQRYKRGERIGIGGMAEVFRGVAVGAEDFVRPVAIKRMLAHLSEDPTLAARFVAEARVASRLLHPNIVAVLDFDRDEDRRLVLVMELVDGLALDAVIASGPLPLAIARHVAIEILRGLDHAHASADTLVHGDVSPHNVLVGWDGAVKLSDFGMAQVPAGPHLGKPGYVAPEWRAGRPLGPSADLYALGVVLWEMVTGERVVAGEVVPRPRTIRPEIPEELEAIVLRLLDEDPDHRYATAAAAIEDLALVVVPVGDGRGGHHAAGRAELVRLLGRRFTRGGRRRAGHPITRPRTRAPAPVRVRRPRRRRARLWWIVLAVGALLGIGLGVIAGS